jgi:anti-sigma B factor antagonist
MQFEEQKVSGRVVLKILESRFGADKAVGFKEHMTRYIQAGNRRIVLDLAKVDFIDSSGLGAILSVLKMMGKDGELVVCGLTEPVASMFKLTRMDRVFTIHKTAEIAVAASAN